MQWYWVIAVSIIAIAALLHALGLVRFDTDLHWTAWLVVALVLLNGGWMAFDGGRALIVGDYVTPQSGQLGPWAKVVEAVGIAPRSSLMKSTFLIYGVAFLVLAAALALGVRWVWWGLLVVALLGLWYIPFGTLINGTIILLLIVSAQRSV